MKDTEVAWTIVLSGLIGAFLSKLLDMQLDNLQNLGSWFLYVGFIILVFLFVLLLIKIIRHKK